MPVIEANLSVVALSFAVLWLLGSITSYTMGGFLHIFLLVAIALMLPRFIFGRKAAE